MKLESIPECGGETDASEADIHLSDLDLTSFSISTIQPSVQSTKHFKGIKIESPAQDSINEFSVFSQENIIQNDDEIMSVLQMA